LKSPLQVDGYRRPSVVQDWDEGLLRFVEANALKLGACRRSLAPSSRPVP
jgi:hypothetical protein